jgi:hypothetical protein
VADTKFASSSERPDDHVLVTLPLGVMLYTMFDRVQTIISSAFIGLSITLFTATSPAAAGDGLQAYEALAVAVWCITLPRALGSGSTLSTRQWM